MTQTMLLASTSRCLQTIPAGGNRFVSILPLSHIMEQVAGLIYAVAARAETEYITTLRPDVIAAAIRGHRATALVVVPQVLELLFSAIRREADRSGKGASFRRALRIAPLLPGRRCAGGCSGRSTRPWAASCAWSCAPPRTSRPRLQRSWEALGVEVIQGYGSTEAGLVASNFRGRAPVDRVGWWLSPAGAPRRAGRRGRRPRAVRVRRATGRTRSRRPPRSPPTAGTGPATTARSTPRGALRLIGRTRSLIALPNGMNVHPEDVEAALAAEGIVEPVVYDAGHGRIAVAYRAGAAFGDAVPDERGGRRPRGQGRERATSRRTSGSWSTRRSRSRTSRARTRARCSGAWSRRG